MPGDALSHEFDAIVENYAQSEYKPPETEEEQDLIASIDSWFVHDLDAKTPFESDWEFYRQYLKGEQLIAQNRETGEVLRIAEDDSKRLRSVMNVLRPTSRSLVGKMCRTIPSWDVTPASSDFDEIHGARVAKLLLDHAIRSKELERKYVEAHEYIPWSGNCFFQLIWNSHGGRKRAYCPQCDFSEPDEDMIGLPCPACQEMQQQAIMEHQEAVLLAREQELSAVLAELPPGTVPDESMIAGFEDPEAPPEASMEIPDLEEIYEGSPDVLVRDPRHVFPEAGADSLDEAMRVTIKVPLPVPKLRQMFPAFASVIEKEDEIVTDQVGAIRHNYIDGDAETTSLQDHAYLWEIHVRPTERHPHGRIIYRVANRIVKHLGIDLESEVPLEEQQDNPYHVLGRFTLFHIGFDRNPGELWFEPFIAQSWHRQREINRIETQIREWTELVLKPRLLIPINSKISTDEITARGPQLIKHNPAAGPVTPLVHPPWPNEITDRRNELSADIRMQASVTDQDAGISPSDPNGRAMAIIEAESDQQIGPILTRNWSEWRALARAYLQLFRELAPEDTIFSIAGPEGVQTYSFNELILKPGWDVFIEQEDGLSKNKAVRLAQSMDVANVGAFNDPMTGTLDIKAFSNHAKLNLRNQGYDLEATERAAASQVPYKLAKGIPWQPAMEDDPQIFAEVLLGWLRGPGRQLQEKNPELVGMVRQIWMWYGEMVVANLQGNPPPPPMQVGGGAEGAGGSGMGGPDQSAPGGSTNNPGHLGTDISSQAGQQVADADRGGEFAAKVQSQHEG